LGIGNRDSSGIDELPTQLARLIISIGFFGSGFPYGYGTIRLRIIRELHIEWLYMHHK